MALSIEGIRLALSKRARDLTGKVFPTYLRIRHDDRVRARWVLHYLEETLGGRESFKRKLPVDSNAAPLPWYTYPAIAYLQQLDFSACNIFEYGSGNGSRFWAARAATVKSVESDPDWYDAGIVSVSANQKLLHFPDMERYVTAIDSDASSYDVIVIDGEYRYNCAAASIQRLKPGGLIILDNSDWFPNTAALLRNAGFTQSDFIGAGPINSYAWCTSVFFSHPFGIPRRPGDLEVQGGLRQYAEHDKPL